MALLLPRQIEAHELIVVLDDDRSGQVSLIVGHLPLEVGGIADLARAAEPVGHDVVGTEERRQDADPIRGEAAGRHPDRFLRLDERPEERGWLDRPVLAREERIFQPRYLVVENAARTVIGRGLRQRYGPAVQRRIQATGEAGPGGLEGGAGPRRPDGPFDRGPSLCTRPALERNARACGAE